MLNKEKFSQKVYDYKRIYDDVGYYFLAIYILKKDINNLSAFWAEGDKPLIKLTLLLNYGLIKEISYVLNITDNDTTERIIINFINTNELFKLDVLTEATNENKRNLFKSHSKVLIEDKELINKIKSINPEFNLTEYIYYYFEVCNRINKTDEINEYLLTVRRLPILKNIWEFNISLLDYSLYLDSLVSKDTVLSDILYLLCLELGIEIKPSIALVNKSFKLFNEREVLELSQSIEGDDNVKLIFNRILLEKKFRAINNKLIKYENEKDFAICISGQIREINQCLEFWFKFALKNSLPLFISTWDLIGAPRGSHGNKLDRSIPNTFKPIFRCMSTYEFESILEIESLEDNILSRDLLIKLEDKYPNVEVYYQITDEKDFNLKYEKVWKDKNQFKMFYQMNNVYFLLKQHEEKVNIKYKNVIWARPDLLVKSFTPALINDNCILTSLTGPGDHCGDLLFQCNRRYFDFISNIHMLLLKGEKVDSFWECNGPLLLGRMANYKGLYFRKFLKESLDDEGLKSFEYNKTWLIEKLTKVDFSNTLNSEIKFYADSIHIISNGNVHNIIGHIKRNALYKDFLVDFIRDYAVDLKIVNSKKAIELLEIALYFRPKGLLIYQLLETLKKGNC